MNNLGYLFAGFALAWGGSFVYLWMLARRSTRLQQQIEQLESHLRRD